MKSYTITRSRFYEESGITSERLRKAVIATGIEPPRCVQKTPHGERFLRSEFSGFIGELTLSPQVSERTTEMMMAWLEDWT